MIPSRKIEDVLPLNGLSRRVGLMSDMACLEEQKDDNFREKVSIPYIVLKSAATSEIFCEL